MTSSETGEPPQDDVRASVALAEDDPEMRALIASVLRREGYAVTEIHDGTELLDFVASRFRSDGRLHGVDLLISDVRMPGFTGLHVVSALRRLAGKTPVILITAFGDEAIHEFAKALDVTAVLDKPFALEALTSEVATALTAGG